MFQIITEHAKRFLNAVGNLDGLIDMPEMLFVLNKGPSFVIDMVPINGNPFRDFNTYFASHIVGKTSFLQAINLFYLEFFFICQIFRVNIKLISYFTKYTVKITVAKYKKFDVNKMLNTISLGNSSLRFCNLFNKIC